MLQAPRALQLTSSQCQSHPYLSKCQGCRTIGHSVSQCLLYQLVLTFTDRAPSHSPARHSSAPYNCQCHPMAHVTTSPSQASPPWLLDSGAYHHVTTNLNNLNLHAPYDGPDDIVIGDGIELHITHSSSTSLFIPSHSFTLQNVLCVPNMKRNLISISQFFKTNKTSVEFLPSSFHVKDLKTRGAILIHSRSKDLFYEWSTKPSTSIIAFSSVKASSSN